MNRRNLLGVAALLALGGGAYWMSEYVDRHGTPAGGPSVDEDATAGEAQATAGAAGDVTATATTADASLANSGRDPRPTTGVGSVVARIVRSSDQLALTGVLVRLEGASAAGDRVQRLLWSDARGDVRFGDVPRGFAYAVHVQRDPNPPVDRTAIVVRTDETTDLGPIALEAVGVLDALVLDEARQPIEGATVTVSFDTGRVVEAPASAWPVVPELPGAFAKGATDDRGRLRLEGIPPGPVAVRATSPEYRGRSFRTFVPQEAPRTAFVPFVLEKGRTYGGRVSDELGHPIAGARVEFGFDGVEAFDPKASVQTTEDGRFFLHGCQRLDAFELRVSAAGYATEVVSPPSGTGGDRWLEGRRAVEPTPIEVVLDKSATLAVVVLDALSGAAVSGARVRCTLSWLPSPPGAPAARTTFEARSDVLGVAAIPIPAGRTLDVEVVSDEHRTFLASHAGVSVQSAGGQLTGDLVSAPVAGERREVSVLLARGHTLAGIVTAEDGLDRPIVGAIVALRHGDRRAFEVRTDANGRFERKDMLLPDRAPFVAVTAAGFDPVEWGVRDAPVRGGVVEVHIPLHPTDRALRIEGRVVDVQRKPVEGALVRILGRSLMAYTGPDGGFRFVAVPRRVDPTVEAPKEVQVVVSKGAARAEPTRAVPRPIDGDAVAFGDVRLDPVAEITGVVLIGKTTNRARYPLVELLGGPTHDVVATLVGGEFGDYQFVDRVAGSYWLRARDGARAGGRSVAVRDGAALPSFADVHLVEARICAGRVEDADRKPIAGLVVRLDCDEARENEGDTSLSETSTTTDGEGGFRFRCFGARPRSLHGVTSSHGREREWRQNVDDGEGNVIRLRRSEYARPEER